MKLRKAKELGPIMQSSPGINFILVTTSWRRCPLHLLKFKSWVMENIWSQTVLRLLLCLLLASYGFQHLTLLYLSFFICEIEKIILLALQGIKTTCNLVSIIIRATDTLNHTCSWSLTLRHCSQIGFLIGIVTFKIKQKYILVSKSCTLT